MNETTARAKPKAPNRSAAEQARDLFRKRFREEDYDELMRLLQRENKIVLLNLQQAMDNLEEPVQS